MVPLLIHGGDKVLEGAVGTLWNLTSSAKNDVFFIRQLPLSTMTNLLARSSSMRVHVGVVNILNNLVSGKSAPETLLMMMAIEGIVPVVRKLLEKNPKDEETIKLHQKARSLLERFASKRNLAFFVCVVCLFFFLYSRATEDMFYMLTMTQDPNVQLKTGLAIAALCGIEQFQPDTATQGEVVALICRTLPKATTALANDLGLGLRCILASSRKVEVPVEDPPESGTPSFSELFNSHKFSDVEFLVEGRGIPAHKIVLSMASPYFEHMFTDGMRESRAPQVQIPDKSHKIFLKVLQSCYQSRVEFADYDEAVQLLLAADQYLLTKLRRMCELYIGTTISEDNVFELLEFSTAFNFAELKRAALRWILNNWDDLLEAENGLEFLVKASFVTELEAFVLASIQHERPPAEPNKQ